jgi:hypothetical protein
MSCRFNFHLRSGIMNKLASIALTTVLGVCGIACATSANASPYFRAEVALPRVVVAPFAYAPGFYPGYYAHAPYGYAYRRFEPRRWGYGWDRRFYRR